MRLSVSLIWIEIISTPDGETPEWVRVAWVGLKLPVYLLGDEELVQERNTYGTITRRSERRSGPSVIGVAAFEILQQANPRAWEWWRDNTSLVRDMTCALVFFGDCWRECNPPDDIPDLNEMLRALSN